MSKSGQMDGFKSESQILIQSKEKGYFMAKILVGTSLVKTQVICNLSIYTN